MPRRHVVMIFFIFLPYAFLSQKPTKFQSLLHLVFLFALTQQHSFPNYILDYYKREGNYGILNTFLFNISINIMICTTLCLPPPNETFAAAFRTQDDFSTADSYEENLLSFSLSMYELFSRNFY